MNWDIVEGDWKQFGGKVKQQWAKLTDDDIALIDGSRQRLEGKIQTRYGNAKEQVVKEVDDWLGRASPETADQVLAATGRQVGDAAQERYDRTLDAIRREPLKGVAVAAGIGFIAALLLRR